MLDKTDCEGKNHYYNCLQTNENDKIYPKLPDKIDRKFLYETNKVKMHVFVTTIFYNNDRTFLIFAPPIFGQHIYWL